MKTRTQIIEKIDEYESMAAEQTILAEKAGSGEIHEYHERKAVSFQDKASILQWVLER